MPDPGPAGPDALRGWQALAAATRATRPRVPFAIDGRVVGSVAVEHLPALRRFAALQVQADGVALVGPAAARDEQLARIHDTLRADGLILAWRDEPFALPDPRTLAPLARIERAAARFWGTLTFGVHANGVVDAGANGVAGGAAEGPPRLWIAQRSAGKATDPGLFDNLVGGGVPHGQPPADALVREGHEEAGLPPAVMARARPAGVLRLARDIPEGFQHEWLYAFDLPLAAGEIPHNLDGEVQGFRLLPAAEALALARADGAMTVDAALVTLDWAARQGLIDAPPVLAVLDTLRIRGV